MSKQPSRTHSTVAPGVAWPAKFDDTGVMTFIVNQDGIVYQKSLGPNTHALARAMKTYDPDASWQKASPGAK